MNFCIKGIDIFREAGLLKTYIGGMSHLQKLVCEKFKDKYFNSNGKRCAVGCCYNSIPMYARLEEDIPKIRTLSYIGQISSPDHHALEVQENGKTLYDNMCPKIAWGFTAFILPNAEFNSNGKIESFNNLPALCNEYYNWSYEIYQQEHRNEYNNAVASNQIDVFNSMFAEKHLNEERKLLNKCKITSLGNSYLSATHKYHDYVQAKITTEEEEQQEEEIVVGRFTYKESNLDQYPNKKKFCVTHFAEDFESYLQIKLTAQEIDVINILVYRAYLNPLWELADKNRKLNILKRMITIAKKEFDSQWYDNVCDKIIQYFNDKYNRTYNLSEMKVYLRKYNIPYEAEVHFSNRNYSNKNT